MSRQFALLGVTADETVRFICVVSEVNLDEAARKLGGRLRECGISRRPEFAPFTPPHQECAHFDPGEVTFDRLSAATRCVATLAEQRDLAKELRGENGHTIVKYILVSAPSV